MMVSLFALFLATPGGGGVVRGAVLDAATGRPISGAVVAVVNATPPRVTNASAVGTFAIRLPGDTASLVAALIGYAPDAPARRDCRRHRAELHAGNTARASDRTGLSILTPGPSGHGTA